MDGTAIVPLNANRRFAITLNADTLTPLRHPDRLVRVAAGNGPPDARQPADGLRLHGRAQARGSG
jgi:hypothetical protein